MARVKKPPRTRPRLRHFFRDWRKYRGYSIEAAAEKIGMSRENLGRMERGEIPYDQDWLEAASAVYECAPADLIARDPKKPQLLSIFDALKPRSKEAALTLLNALKVADDAEDAA